MNNIKDQENLYKSFVEIRFKCSVKNGLITDETRIDKIIPVINFLIKKESKIIILMGRKW